MSLLHIGGGSGSSVVAPEGVDFDGVSDYLSRSTDLVGNIDSKTFTFSAWVYRVTSSQQIIVSSYTSGVGEGIHIYISSGNQLYINCYNSSGTAIVVGYSQSILTSNTFLNILISLDTSSQGNSKLYINDIQSSITWTTFTNSFIDCTKPNHSVSASTTGTNKLKGRLSNVFLDYTYRDLSIEANRRLFITADGKPTPTATLKALNPILYLPMKDASTAHVNLGTGGNMVQNGTLATADRGANQDNCVASLFNGTSQYLSMTSLTGISNIGKATINFTIKATTTSYENIYFAQSGSYKLTINIGGNSGRVTIVARNSSNSVILNAYSNTQVCTTNKIYNISISFDLSITNSTKLVVNGINTSITNGTFINDIIPFSTINQYYISRDSSGYSNIELGELYFDTKYIDLATNNPFWDSKTNKPIPVRKAMANLGSNPLICMPISADNPTKNYGSGGDFTLNG